MTSKFMSILRLICLLRGASILKTIYYNFFSGKIIPSSEHCSLGVPNREDLLIIGKDAKLVMKQNARIYVSGVSYIGFNTVDGVYKAILDMEEGSNLRIGEGSVIISGAEITIERDAFFEIGKNVDINRYDLIVCSKRIVIGQGVKMAPNVTIRDRMGHKPNGIDRCSEIIIGEHVWVGTGATFLPGASIGNGSVVGAHSLVNKSFPSNCLIVGIPAIIKKQDFFWEE